MIENERIDISGGIDVNKTNLSKECDIFTIGILKVSVLDISLIFVMGVMI